MNSRERPSLCFGHFPIALGDTTRAVIVPFSEVSLTRWWRLVRPGERLEKHEGPRVCGIATVAWTAFTEQRISETDEANFCSWTRGSQ